MAQPGKCLPWQRGEQSVVPRTPVRKLSTVACTCDFRAGELGKGGFLELSGRQPSLLGDSERTSTPPPAKSMWLAPEE